MFQADVQLFNCRCVALLCAIALRSYIKVYKYFFASTKRNSRRYFSADADDHRSTTFQKVIRLISGNQKRKVAR